MKPGVMMRTGLAAVLSLYLAGCSGLSPQKPVNPIDPNSPCNLQLSIFTPLNGSLVSVGTDTTLDVLTWNIQNFPKSGATTISKVAQIINTLNVDVLALQEIEDTTSFRTLLTMIPNYAGVYSPDVYGFGGYQKTAVIYRKAAVTMNGPLRVPNEFLNNSYAFPRPPIEVDVTASERGRTYHFRIIVVHLKAGGEEDAPRRRAGTAIMHAYLDAREAAEPNVDYMIAGDWNDELTDPMSITSFPDFLADPSDYQFLTTLISTRNYLASHASNRTLDHILVNRAACSDFMHGRITTLRIDIIDSSYSPNVSDHRPVLISTPVFN